jgi:two-component system sensor histidine kinase/response regulator
MGNTGGKSKKYIICVDDDWALLDVLTQQLESAFSDTHDIEGAESAGEALELIDTLHQTGNTVEMVIADQVMPGMKGDQLLKHVHEKYPDIVTVMLTGQGGLDSAIQAINYAGLSKYLLKPWDKEDLKLTIRDLLDKYKLEKENKRLFLELKQAYQHLKDTQEQLIHSEKLAIVGKITAGIAHEIRNQLTILSFAEVIKMAVPDNEQVGQYVKNILDVRDRILSIVDEIRQFAKNQVQLYAKDVCSLTDIVDMSLNIMSYDKEAKKRKFVKTFRAFPVLKLNRDKISQVLINLIRNAVQATREAGEITISVAQNQGHVRLQVADNGCGIPPENLPKIWQPFFTTKEEEGTGLGLEICKRIIEGHDGKIYCESKVGVGTTFTIELPINASES